MKLDIITIFPILLIFSSTSTAAEANISACKKIDLAFTHLLEMGVGTQKIIVNMLFVDNDGSDFHQQLSKTYAEKLNAIKLDQKLLLEGVVALKELCPGS